jgi:enolase
MEKITKIRAREVLDSRGNPTVEVEVRTQNSFGRAIVPSGASTGVHEAVELRDSNKKRYGGKGVQAAVNNVNSIIFKNLKNFQVTDQRLIDQTMIDLDKTENKSRLGANAILGVSMAVARAAANSMEQPLYKYLNKRAKTLPIPFSNIINGGKHAGNELNMQEFMIAPIKAKNFTSATQMVAETYQELKGIISNKFGKNAVNVGDEGGFAPPIKTPDEALDMVTKALSEVGYEKKMRIAMDPAASEYYKNGKYTPVKKALNSTKAIEFYEDLVKRYPIISIEDPFDQDDFDSFKEFTKRNKKLQVVGDDLLVTNPKRIRTAIDQKLCNALLLKVNQIGTLSQAMDAAKMSMRNNWNVMVSHRSGETEDPFIADLSVALGNGQIKLGAPARSDRVAKYNQLLRIEEELGIWGKYSKF